TGTSRSWPERRAWRRRATAVRSTDTTSPSPVAPATSRSTPAERPAESPTGRFPEKTRGRGNGRARSRRGAGPGPLRGAARAGRLPAGREPGAAPEGGRRTQGHQQGQGRVDRVPHDVGRAEGRAAEDVLQSREGRRDAPEAATVLQGEPPQHGLRDGQHE